MKRWNKMAVILTAAACVLGSSFSSLAAEVHSGTVVYDGTTMKNDIDTTLFGGLTPGDEVILEVELQNKSGKSGDFYIQSDFITNLNQKARETGSFEYEIAYDGQSLLENSNLVDEDVDNGTKAMEGYKYLDTLPAGGSGKVALRVKIDGETQKNDYQLALNQLSVNFAVTDDVATTNTATFTETRPSRILRGGDQEGTGIIPAVVRTGDTFKLELYTVLFVVFGVLLLGLGVYSFYCDSKKKKEA